MSERKINLEEIIERCWDNRKNAVYSNPYKNCMLEFGKQLLELAAENAAVEELYGGKSCRIDNAFYENDDTKIIVNKQSILNTIKQVT